MNFRSKRSVESGVRGWKFLVQTCWSFGFEVDSEFRNKRPVDL